MQRSLGLNPGLGQTRTLASSDRAVHVGRSRMSGVGSFDRATVLVSAKGLLCQAGRPGWICDSLRVGLGKRARAPTPLRLGSGVLRGNLHGSAHRRSTLCFAQRRIVNLAADNTPDDSAAVAPAGESHPKDQETIASKEEGMTDSLWVVPWDGGCDAQHRLE
eukprot:8624687-Pyramimonas_sp.AAC.1